MVTILPLLDICFDGSIEITTSAGVKYVQPLRLTYTTDKKLLYYLRDMPEDTMHEIKTAISAGLGLTLAEPSSPATVPAVYLHSSPLLASISFSSVLFIALYAVGSGYPDPQAERT